MFVCFFKNEEVVEKKGRGRGGKLASWLLVERLMSKGGRGGWADARGETVRGRVDVTGGDCSLMLLFLSRYRNGRPSFFFWLWCFVFFCFLVERKEKRGEQGGEKKSQREKDGVRRMDG